jgi:hypothetical protein
MLVSLNSIQNSELCVSGRDYWLGTFHRGGGGTVRGSGSEETNWPEL